jgi:ribosomal protein S18 acetylase RimI-like enzyme
MVEFIQVDLSTHKEILINLNEEYLTWVTEQFKEIHSIDISAPTGQTTQEYARKSVDNIASYTPPQGIYYLLKMDDKIIGMGALRQIRDGIGEIKRMYVKPEYRGKGIGRALLVQLLKKAEDFNFTTIRIDTAGWMKIAQRMYYSAGFRYREEYPESEIPQSIHHLCVFMEKKL